MLSLPVLQVVWLRFLTHALFSVAVFAPSMGLTLVRWRQPRLQLLRGMMLASMTGLNFWALQYLQLAETGAMQFSVPILIAVLSAWWLGERLDARRWVAIAAGFIGVLIMARPVPGGGARGCGSEPAESAEQEGAEVLVEPQVVWEGWPEQMV